MVNLFASRPSGSEKEEKYFVFAVTDILNVSIAARIVQEHCSQILKLKLGRPIFVEWWFISKKNAL